MLRPWRTLFLESCQPCWEAYQKYHKLVDETTLIVAEHDEDGATETPENVFCKAASHTLTKTHINHQQVTLQVRLF